MKKPLLGAALTVLLLQQVVFSSEKLIIIGGGNYPQEALKQFSEWAGGNQAKVISIHWGTEDPVGGFEWFKAHFSPYQPASLENVPSPSEEQSSVVPILRSIQSATGIFFGGGDQAMIMKQALKYPEIVTAILRRFREGIVIMGTSAGAAIMSKTMITGTGDFTVIDPKQVETASGMGFLEHIVVDQHFIRRQRMNRLISVLTASHEYFGIGIDEDTALALVDGKEARVLGGNKVVRIERENNSKNFGIAIYSAGEFFSF